MLHDLHKRTALADARPRLVELDKLLDDLPDVEARPEAAVDWLLDALDDGALDLAEAEELLGEYRAALPDSLERRLSRPHGAWASDDVLAAVRGDAVAPRQGAGRCVIGDGPQAEAIAHQLERLLPALGIATNTFAIAIDERAAAVARARGTLGVAIDGRIYLDAAAFDASSALGREVIAHELTHVAQWRLGRAQGERAPSQLGAEAEAATLARVWVGGHVPARPVVPLGAVSVAGGEPAGFAFLDTVVKALGAELRGDFFTTLADDLEGTVGASLVPTLRKWAAGELEGPDEVAADEAERDPTAADKAAEQIGKAGAGTLEEAGAVTLFFIRAFFGLLSKLKLLPVGFRSEVGPFALQVGATADFKTIELYGRIEIDFAALHDLFAGLLGMAPSTVAAGTEPDLSAPEAKEKKLFAFLGSKKAKVDESRDLHMIVPWKDPVAGWSLLIPPVGSDAIGGWDSGRVDMQGFVLEHPHLALPSLGDILVWSAGGARLPRVVLEADRLALGVDNALRGVRTDPGTVDLDVTFPGMDEPIGGLAGVHVAGDIDLANDDAELAARAERAWIGLWGMRAELGGVALKYSGKAGPSTEAASFDVDLGGWFQVHAEDLRLDLNGFSLALLRVPVPEKIQAILSSFESLRWSLVPKDGGAATSGHGIPPLALAWHDLHIGRDGFRAVPSLEPDLSQFWLSLAIGDVFTVTGISASLTGLETWLESPKPDAPPPTPKLSLSALSGVLQAFGQSATCAAVSAEADADGNFAGSVGAAAIDLTAGVAELHAGIAGLAIANDGFSIAKIGLAMVAGGEALSKHWPALAVLPTLALGAELLDLSYDGTAWQAGDATFRVGELISLTVPGAFVTDLLRHGLDVDWSLLGLTPEHLATLAKTVGAAVIDAVAAKVNEVVAYAEEVIQSWWDTIRAWIPGLSDETPPQMDGHDVVVARVVGEEALWPEIMAHTQRLDDNIGALEPIDRSNFDEAKQKLAAGAIGQAFTQLADVAASDGDAAAAAFFQGVLTRAATLEASLASGDGASTNDAADGTADDDASGDDAHAELDVLMAEDRLEPDDIAHARELIAELPEAERADYYTRLQAKSSYHSQRDNTSRSRLEGQGETLASADNMCNLTSLAMCFEQLGVRNPGVLNGTCYPQFEDYLEALRIDKGLVDRQAGATWAALGKLMSPPVVYKDLGLSGAIARATWESVVGPQLAAGNAVQMSIDGHVVRVQAIAETGLVVDDPYGATTLGAGKAHTFTGRNSTGDEATDETAQRGEDHVYPWADVEKHSMKYVFSWSGAPD